MRLIETFLLDIRPRHDGRPAKVRIAVPHMAATGGRVYLTPECISLDEVESHSNALQDELDQLRERHVGPTRQAPDRSLGLIALANVESGYWPGHVSMV